MKALHKLIQHKDQKFDDRRFAIEVQFDRDINLQDRKPLLAIFPETYLSNEEYISKITGLGCEILTYPVYPLRKEYFYYAIYQKLDDFYSTRALQCLTSCFSWTSLRVGAWNVGAGVFIR